MTAKQQQFLVSYDIANPRRLRRIHRCLKKSGLPVQYSVFSMVCNKPRLLSVLEQLEALMNPSEDDLRCYTLPVRVECSMLGKQTFPDDVYFFSNGVSQLFKL